MRKILVNGSTEVRTLSPFAYKDVIKTLDKSEEARVTLDGTRVAKSAVTSGRDVKSGSGALKYHLYFYPTADAAKARDTARREFLPITAEEYRAYKNDPGYVLALVSVTVPPSLVAPAESVAESVAESERPAIPTPAEIDAEIAEIVANPGPSRKARRGK